VWHSYKSYLRSDVWKEKRNSAIERAQGRCQVCNSENKLEVHHRKYPSILGQEPLEDLTVLCKSCHELYTFKIQIPIKLKKEEQSQSKNIKNKKEYKLSKGWGITTVEEGLDDLINADKIFYRKKNKIQKARERNLKDLEEAKERGESVTSYQRKAIQLNKEMMNLMDNK
jgi:hypothetical protein